MNYGTENIVERALVENDSAQPSLFSSIRAIFTTKRSETKNTVDVSETDTPESDSRLIWFALSRGHAEF